MKKIVYIIEDITEVGGREIITLRKAEALAEKGYDISIISHNCSNVGNLISNSQIKFYDLSVKRKGLSKKNFSCKLESDLSNKINEIDPDYAIFMINNGLNAYVNLKIKAKKIMEIHGSYYFYHDFLGKKKGLIRKIQKKIKFFSLKKRISRFDKSVLLFESDTIRWNFTNSLAIPNFINSNNLENKNCNPKKIFISAGRLSYEKGFDLLIDIWDLIVKKGFNYQLDIYGEGPEKNKLLEKIKKYNLQNIIKIHPFDKNLVEKYADYYAYVLPSRCEAFPMVVLESFQSCLPVFAFDTQSGVNELIANDLNGYIINDYNLELMAEKITALTDEKRELLSKNAYKTALNYTQDKIIDMWVDFLK